jgi:hypothetical protein
VTADAPIAQFTGTMPIPTGQPQYLVPSSKTAASMNRVPFLSKADVVDSPTTRNDKIAPIVLDSKDDTATATAKEAATTTTSEPKDYVGPIIPEHNDVLFGRGQKNHPGSVVLRQVMDGLEETYESATKGHKMELTCVIVQSMLWSGARFLVKEDEQWNQISYIEAHRKVSKALRNRRRSKSRV